MTRQEKKALFEQVERSINVPSQPHGLEAAVLAEIMNFQNRDGRTLLMRSTTKEQLEMSRTLIEMGADVNLQDKKGWSALHFAAQSYLPDHTLLLLEHGADVHLQDVYGNTPLQRAVFESRGRGAVIALLLQHGSNPDQENHYGVSPRILANTIANFDVKQFF